ncbi:phage tail protein [Lentzea chajnantorensis]
MAESSGGTGAVIVARAGVRILPDTTRFGPALSKYLTRVEQRTVLNVGLGVNEKAEKKFQAELQKLVGRAEKVTEVAIPATLDGAAAERDLKVLAAQLKSRAPKVDVDLDVDRAGQIRKAISAFTRLGGGVAGTTLKIGAFAAVAGAAVNGAVGVTAAVAAMSGALAAVPAFGVAAAAGVVALKVGLSGFGEALKQVGDPEKFAEALKQLSPAAQSVAREFERLQPAFKALREQVQDALFSQLKDQLTDTANVLLGPLKAGMSAVTAEAGQLAAALLGVARESKTVDLLSGAFDTARGAIASTRDGVIAVVRGFRDLATAALPAVSRLAQSANSTAVAFGQWLTRISESGQAMQWITDAAAALRQVGGLLRQVGGIVHAVLSAATDESSGLTGTLTELLRSVNTFLSAGEGRDALLSVMRALREAGQVLAPVIESLVKALGRIVEPAAKIAKALGPGVTKLIDGLGQALAKLGPGLETVAQQLSDAFADPRISESLINLGQALTDVLIAAAPLIPPLARLAELVANVFSRNLTTSIPIVRKFAAGLALVIDKAATGADWINKLANDFSRWLYFDKIGGALSDAGAAIGRLIGWFTDFGDAVSSLSLSDFTGALSGAASAVGRWLSDLGDQASSGLSSFVDSVVVWFQELPGRIVTAVQQLPGVLWRLLHDAFIFAATAVGTGIGYIVGALVALPIAFAKLGGELGLLLWQQLTAAWEYATTAISTGVDNAVTWASSLPGRILTAVVSLQTMLGTWARSAWEWASTTGLAAAEQALAWAAGLPGRIVSAVGSLAASLGAWASNAWSSARSATVSAGEGILAWVALLPSRIVAVLGNLGSLLMESGRALIRGFIDGIKSMFGAVSDAASGIVQTVKDFFPRSPAKRGPLSGSGYTDRSGIALARDFASGMRSGVPLVVSASRELTQAVRLSGDGITTTGDGTTQAGGITVTQHIDARGADADSVISTSENRLLHALRR